jgi:uncharacterized membrane protein YciS (DUF1049 family)
MTKQQLSENTPWVIKTGVIAGLLLSGAVWFHSRLAAVEIAQEASKTKLDMIYEMVKDIKAEVKK